MQMWVVWVGHFVEHSYLCIYFLYNFVQLLLRSTAPVRTDGKARCVNYGCQKEYVVAENAPDACVHHTGPPVFHDAGKFWSCCPKLVKYDFDSFLQVPGCATASHSATRSSTA